MTPAEKSALRARAQNLSPAVRIGHDGLTPAIVQELDVALRRTDLVKIRFEKGRDILRAQCVELAAGTASTCVGGVGRVASFYRAKPAPALEE
jgi:RNA-binding protein